jgi:hypothetical protein
LDNILFAGLKQNMTTFCEQIFDVSQFWEKKCLDLRNLVLEAVCAKLPNIFTSQNIQAAW